MQLKNFFLTILSLVISTNIAVAQQPAEPARAEIQPPKAEEVNSSTPGYRLNATTVAQLEDLKDQIKALRGDIEQLQFDNARLNEKIVKFSSDVEFRFAELNKGPNKAAEKDIFNNIDTELDNDLILEDSDTKKTTKTKPKDAAVDAKIKEKTEQEEYDDAYSYIKQKKYKDAKEGFTHFVQKYSDTDLAGNAHYWLGEINFMSKSYDKAAVEYLKGYQASIRGSRAADNLLKLGKSLSRLEKRKEACTTLTKLQKEFPNTSTQIKKQSAEEMKTLHCN